MLIIDKQLTENYLYVTASEKKVQTDTVFRMVLQSEYTNKTYNLLLGDNLSAYPGRYDKFLVNLLDIQPWEPGTYSYTIWESINFRGEYENINILEQGVLKVIGPEQIIEPFDVIIQPNETMDDFKVYQNN